MSGESQAKDTFFTYFFNFIAMGGIGDIKSVSDQTVQQVRSLGSVDVTGISQSVKGIGSKIGNIQNLITKLKTEKSPALQGELDALENRLFLLEDEKKLDNIFLSIVHMVLNEIPNVNCNNELMSLYVFILLYIRNVYIQGGTDGTGPQESTSCQKFIQDYLNPQGLTASAQAELKTQEDIRAELTQTKDVSQIYSTFHLGEQKFLKQVIHQAKTNAKNIVDASQNNMNLRVSSTAKMVDTTGTANEAQKQSIATLNTMLSYINQQANEYSEVYARLQALNATQQRKSAFHVKDLKTLNRWSFWCRVIFWVLVVFLVLMVLVDKYSAVASFTATVDDKLKRMATAATQIAAAGQ